MGKNTKPMLTVLVEGDKLQQFRDYALSKDVSMGWVVNRLLDRVLSGELDVMGDSPSIEKARGYVENTSTGLTKEDVESMIKSSIDNQLTSSTRDYIEKTIKSYIDSLGVSSTGTNDIEEVTRASIEAAIEPIKESVLKPEAEVRAITSRAVVPTDSITTSTTNLEPRQEPTDLTFRDFCEHYGIKVPDGTSNQPTKAVVDKYIAQVESMGHHGWSWKGTRKHLVRVTESA
jgi:hypothetical protein